MRVRRRQFSSLSRSQHWYSSDSQQALLTPSSSNVIMKIRDIPYEYRGGERMSVRLWDGIIRHKRHEISPEKPEESKQ